MDQAYKKARAARREAAKQARTLPEAETKKKGKADKSKDSTPETPA